MRAVHDSWCELCGYGTRFSPENRLDRLGGSGRDPLRKP